MKISNDGNFEYQFKFCVDGTTSNIKGGLDERITFKTELYFDKDNPTDFLSQAEEEYEEVLWYQANAASEIIGNNPIATTLGTPTNTSGIVLHEVTTSDLQIDGIENGIYHFGVVHRAYFINNYNGFDGSYSLDTTFVSVNISTVPIPQFTWSGITAGLPTTFDLIDITSEGSKVDYNFKISSVDVEGNVSATPIFEVSTYETNPQDLSNSNSEIEYTFSQAGIYESEFTVISAAGCEITRVRRYRVLKKIDLGGDFYSESFEAGDGGWFAAFQSDDGLSGSYSNIIKSRISTWEYGSPDGSTINKTKDGSINGKAWATTGTYVQDAVNNYVGGEDSWVYSPSFDFSDLSNPAIQFDTYRDLESSDGVVFQYSTDNGGEWKPLGNYEIIGNLSPSSGSNWYNKREIVAPVGQSGIFNEVAKNDFKVGWSGQYSSEERSSAENGWFTSTHSLDGITDRTNVRFRFALSSMGTPTEPKIGDGFAFDNMRIFSIEKEVLVEHFSSTIDRNAILLERNALSFGEEALYINYFTNLVSNNNITDVLNARNTVGPSLRMLYYGIDEVGTSVLDGAIKRKRSASQPDWSDADIKVAQLGAPDLIIENNELINKSSGNTISITANWIYQGIIDGSEIYYSFYFALVEKSISIDAIDPAAAEIYRNENIDSIYNVFRVFLRNENGERFSTFRGSVPEDKKLEVSASWEALNLYNPSNLRVIAFAQDNNSVNSTNRIIQAAYLDFSQSVDVVSGIDNNMPSIEVYPNPSNEVFTIDLVIPTNEDLEWTLLNLSGKEVLKGSIERGNRLQEVKTKMLSDGLYYIRIYQGGDTYVKRILVVH